jgi:hypothetical protein
MRLRSVGTTSGWACFALLQEATDATDPVVSQAMQQAVLSVDSLMELL